MIQQLQRKRLPEISMIWWWWNFLRVAFASPYSWPHKNSRLCTALKNATAEAVAASARETCAKLGAFASRSAAWTLTSSTASFCCWQPTIMPSDVHAHVQTCFVHFVERDGNLLNLVQSRKKPRHWAIVYLMLFSDSWPCSTTINSRGQHLNSRNSFSQIPLNQGILRSYSYQLFGNKQHLSLIWNMD